MFITPMDQIYKIEKHISKFKDDEREKIVSFYLFECLNYILGHTIDGSTLDSDILKTDEGKEDPRNKIEKNLITKINQEVINIDHSLLQINRRTGNVIIERKQIELLFRLKKYVPDTIYLQILEETIKLKIQQAQTYILDNSKIKLDEKKSHFSNVSKYMKILALDFENTYLFGRDEYADLTTSLMKKLLESFCKLFVLIFYSEIKFNSSANQILIDLFYLKSKFEEFYDFNELINKFKSNFKDGKILDDSYIIRVCSK